MLRIISYSAFSIVVLFSLVFHRYMNKEVFVNPQAEKYINKMLYRKVPYSVEVRDTEIVIPSHQVYPPGRLTEMFARFLIERVDVKDKVIVDVGAGCSALGIILAKNGARKVIGVDINKNAVDCSKMNIAKHHLEDKVDVILGDGVEAVLARYQNKVDLVIAGLPWSTINQEHFDNIDQKKQWLYRAFFDIEDQFASSLMTGGFRLLNGGSDKILITASIKSMGRIKRLCQKYNAKYEILGAEDIHQDGNMHYILGLEKI